MRHVVMFSSGAGSAMAAKRVASSLGPNDHLTLLFADVNMEHPDNYRFLHEAHEWIGGELVILTNGGMTIWDVFTKGRFLGNSRVDLCSRVLKREPMRAWLEQECDPKDTIVYLGFDWTEEHRFTRAIPHWTPWTVKAPLCDEPYIDKAEAMAEMAVQGVEPPWLTRMGFPHANCGGGCVKAGHKQFKKLLKVAPATFAEWETREQEFRDFIGKDVAMLRDRRSVPKESWRWVCDCHGTELDLDRERELVDGLGWEPREHVNLRQELVETKESVTTPLPLSKLRERLGVEPLAYSEGDWGACNCMTPLEDSSSDIEVAVTLTTKTINHVQPGMSLVTLIGGNEWRVQDQFVMREAGQWYCSCDSGLCYHKRVVMKFLIKRAKEEANA